MRSSGITVIRNYFTSNKYFVFSLFIVILITCLRYKDGIIQQDNYLLYAENIGDSLKNIPYHETRLFAGFPYVIRIINFIFRSYILSAYFVVIGLFIVNYSLLKNITKSEFSVIPLIFPPVMLNSTTIIGVESFSVFFVLFTYYLVRKNSYVFASLVSGIGFIFRPIVSVAFPALIISLFIRKREAINVQSILLFLFPLMIISFFNLKVFGELTPFYQFGTYKVVAPHGTGIGILQIIPDLIRSIKWQQYHIFLSGLFYLVMFLLMQIKSFKNMIDKKSLMSIYIFLSIVMMSTFIVSYSFTPFIENLGRYMVPTIPLFWILLHKRLEKELYYIFGFVISFIVILL